VSFADHLLITCEHGGRRVPPLYEPHFDAHRHLLDTHRGIDFGALTLAREMATALGAPLVASTTTRLLVDLNRNVRQKTLFSEATRPLPVEDRQQILRRYHRPHWRRIEAEVDGAIERGRRVVHVAGWRRSDITIRRCACAATTRMSEAAAASAARCGGAMRRRTTSASRSK